MVLCLLLPHDPLLRFLGVGHVLIGGMGAALSWGQQEGVGRLPWVPFQQRETKNT